MQHRWNLILCALSSFVLLAGSEGGEGFYSLPVFPSHTHSSSGRCRQATANHTAGLTTNQGLGLANEFIPTGSFYRRDPLTSAEASNRHGWEVPGQAVVCKGGLQGPCIIRLIYVTCPGIYELLGLCFNLRDQLCLARCANLARQLSSYPYSIWHRSAYKAQHIHEKHIFILHQQTPQTEGLCPYVTAQEKYLGIHHTFR